jgi:hypothetical protein
MMRSAIRVATSSVAPGQGRANEERPPRRRCSGVNSFDRETGGRSVRIGALHVVVTRRVLARRLGRGVTL